MKYKDYYGVMGVDRKASAEEIKNAYRKLEVHSAAAAVMRAVELGLFGQESRG